MAEIQKVMLIAVAVVVGGSFAAQVSAQTEPAADRGVEEPTEQLRGAKKATPEALREKRAGLQKDQEWKQLLDDAKRKGFRFVDGERHAWGTSGESTDEKGKAQRVEIAIYDIENPETREGGAFIWVRQGNRVQSSYLTVPEGADMEAASEFRVGKDGKVQKGRAGEMQTRGINVWSWLRCMRTRVLDQNRCGTTCALSWGGCYIAAHGAFFFAPAYFMFCMQVGCGSCIVIQGAICGL